MTIFAFPFLYFIKNKGVLPDCYILMAFCTGDILVLSVEFKGSGIMIEVCNFPTFKVMTPQAVCGAIIFKLFKMIILVTTGTGC